MQVRAGCSQSEGHRGDVALGSGPPTGLAAGEAPDHLERLLVPASSSGGIFHPVRVAALALLAPVWGEGSWPGTPSARPGARLVS